MAISSSNIEATSQILYADPTIFSRAEYAWLKELVALGYHRREMAELLIDEAHHSKWIYFEPPQSSRGEIAPEYHREGCVHDVLHNLWAMSPTTSTLDHHAGRTQDWIRRCVGKLCGLAGVIPSSRDHTRWNGQVAFSGIIGSCNITFSSPSRIGYPLERRLVNTMRRLTTAFRVLQDESVACDSFNVIRFFKRQSGAITAELVRIEASTILDLSNALEAFLQHDHDERLRLGKLACGIIRDVINPTSPSWLHWLETSAEDQEYLEEYALHLTSFSAQILCLGLLSYVHGHIGTLQPFFLMHPVRMINLKGSDPLSSSDLHIVMEPVRLTCLKGLTGNPVMAFRASNGHNEEPAVGIDMAEHGEFRCDLLASPEDLIDAWGPASLLPSRQCNQLLAVMIGGGIVARLEEDTTSLHWATAFAGRLTHTFDAYSKSFIGAAYRNANCPLIKTLTATLDANSSQTLSIGTSSSYWHVKGISMAMGGGQFFNATATAQLEKRPGVTLKQTLIKRLNTRSDMSLPDLEAYYGVQISLCTGLARRVRLRELLADVLPAYAEAQIPTAKAWITLRDALIHALNGPNFGEWLNTQLSIFQTSIVDLLRKLICDLEQTGFDPTQQKLIVAWIRAGQDNACFRLSCKADTAWAGILQDTEHCATFACVTTQCLLDNSCWCQMREQAVWRGKSKVLNTEVTLFNEEPPTAFDEPFVLKDKARFWIGPPEAGLQATVKLDMLSAEPHLLVTKSLIPETVRNRMFRKHYARRRIRERVSILGKAESVTVIAPMEKI